MDWGIIVEEFPGIWEGVPVTIGLFAWSLLFGTIGGLHLVVEVRRRAPAGVAAGSDFLAPPHVRSPANRDLLEVGVDGGVELAVPDDHHLPVTSQTVPAVDHPP